MNRRFFSLFIILWLAFAATATLFGQAVAVDRLSPQQIFDRCGAACGEVAVTGKSGGIHAAQAENDGPVAILRVVGGQIISGTSAKVYMDIIRDFPEVWVAGRVSYIVDGRLSPDKAFYVGKDISLTRYGPGLFPGLSAGAVIPLGEVFVGNAGDEANLKVVFYDQNGGLPRTISTRLWSQIRPTRGVLPRVQVNSAEVLADGATLRLTGRFPKERLVVGVGKPGWDNGFVVVTPQSEKTITLRIPPGMSGGALYPSGWDGEMDLTFTFALEDGECFTFLGPRVRGDFNRMGIFPAQ